MPFSIPPERSYVPDADLLFTYVGHQPYMYPAYVDAGTGKMLIPEPGGSYWIRAVDGGPVPPPDGRWTALADKKGAPPPAPPAPPPWAPPQVKPQPARESAPATPTQEGA